MFSCPQSYGQRDGNRQATVRARFARVKNFANALSEKVNFLGQGLLLAGSRRPKWNSDPLDSFDRVRSATRVANVGDNRPPAARVRALAASVSP